jgi:cephalosporin-C deacetylase
MAYFDLPLSQLQSYKPERNEPSDFDAFWQATLSDARAKQKPARFEPMDTGLRHVQTFDVTFSGFGGQPIRGWLQMPTQRDGKLPCVVEFVGYGGGRGMPTNHLLYASAGYAHFVMDTRGQGSTWSKGDTPDVEPEGSNPQHPGFMTRGILSPQTYYYRRVMTDAARAVETMMAHDAVDANRIAVTGGSQGGGLSLAAAGLLRDQVKLCLPDVPFLCHFTRATTLIDSAPYIEIQKFCLVHRDKIKQVFDTLSYFDGMNFAARATAASLWSVGLMDEICPPSTVYAAYNQWSGAKDIRIYEFNHHEGGGEYQAAERVKFLRAHW